MSSEYFPFDKLVIVIGNVLFILFLGFQILKNSPQNEIRKHFWFAFSLKVLSGICLGLIYKFYYTYGDTFSIFRDSVKYSNVAFHNLGEYINLLFSSNTFPAGPPLENPNARAVFMTKILSIPNILTLNNYWLSSWYCSFFSFVGIWKCANTLAMLFRKNQFEIAISFFYFPSVLFWTSGIIKESISMGCICLVISLTLSFLYSKRKYTILGFIIRIISIIACLLIIWKLKYYYFAVLTPCLVSYVVAFYLNKFNVLGTISPKIKFTVLFIGITLSATLVHPNLNLETFFKALVKNNTLMAEQTAKKENLIHYNQLEPKIQSIVYNTPRAVIEGLFRPYFWEKGNMFKKLTAIESFLILILVLFNTYHRADKVFWRENSGFSLLVFSSLFYIGTLLLFLSLASPNIGNLVRYQTGFKPFLVLILISGIPIMDMFYKFSGRKKE